MSVDCSGHGEVGNDYVLEDSSAENLSRTFKALVGHQRYEMQPFKDTLSDLNLVVAKFHEAGVDRFGIELADFNSLRELMLIKKLPPDAVEERSVHKNVIFCILSIYDAKFLLRVHQDHVVDCLLDNINKPTKTLQYLDNEAFWFRKEGGEKVERFFRCNLQEETDRVELMTTFIQTAATCAVNRELAKLCLPERKTAGFTKPSAGYSIK